jgi:hypothetical protein
MSIWKSISSDDVTLLTAKLQIPLDT